MKNNKLTDSMAVHLIKKRKKLLAKMKRLNKKIWAWTMKINNLEPEVIWCQDTVCKIDHELVDAGVVIIGISDKKFEDHIRSKFPKAYKLVENGDF